jgi:hypothetical protein
MPLMLEAHHAPTDALPGVQTCSARARDRSEETETEAGEVDMSDFDGFKKITNVRLPYDLRNEDPAKNYGIHGLDIWFILSGPLGAVQFGVTFPQYLPHVRDELAAKSYPYLERIQGFDVGYHAPKPQYENQAAMDDCDLIEGGKCFYDGSSLRASEWADEIFAVRGKRPEDEIWSRLREEYRMRFE